MRGPSNPGGRDKERGRENILGTRVGRNTLPLFL
ncbi:hypothetical protein E2C01_074323 [Portunus trituberculatus]|uniref:Uncharacterized protein n=1 Tax=Portunus trituberculatus TaxID=210409 RepID=A0A5B7IE04_PORTR|nr:hypothetical protein [Portunus trituberculatus]